MLAILAVAGCHEPTAAPRPGEPSRPPAPPRPTQPASDPAPVAAKPAATVAPEIVLSAHRMIEIPAGTLRAGSPTGSPFRDPSREADDVAIAVPAFAIDALPYPNDPDKPVLSGVDRAEADGLCHKQGKRLCSELEWERACKGDALAIYPHYAAGFDPAACRRDARQCATPFGVLRMGALAREWTTDDVSGGLGDPLRTAVVRGAPLDAPLAAHRCSARDAATPDSKSESLWFRCCKGEKPALSYPSEPALAPFRDQTLDDAGARAILERVPTLAALSRAFRVASDRQIDESLRKAGSSRSRMAPWIAAKAALGWSPVRGEDLLVLSGEVEQGAILVVLYVLGAGQYRLVGTFETKDEHLSIVVAYKPDAPKELLFSSCWGCGGEGGAITLGEDARVRIAPR